MTGNGNNVLEIHCPECRGPMVEMDRRVEGGQLFVWYRCVSNLCGAYHLKEFESAAAMTSGPFFLEDTPLQAPQGVPLGRDRLVSPPMSTLAGIA